MKKIIKNFPWTVFVTGISLLILSLIFKACDMAAVSFIGILGSFVVFIRNCRLDKK